MYLLRQTDDGNGDGYGYGDGYGDGNGDGYGNGNGNGKVSLNKTAFTPMHILILVRFQTCTC